MIEYEKNRSVGTDYIYHQNDKNLNFGMHIHKSYEFIYVYEGELILEIEDKTFRINEGCGAVILPNQAHAYLTKHFSKSYLCVFSTSYLYEYYEKTKDLSALNPIFPFPEGIEIASDLQSEENFYLYKYCFYRILYAYTKSVEYERKNKKYHDLIESVIQYINQHFMEDLSLKQLAESLNYEYHYLSGVFNKLFRTNFLHLVNEYRINHAQHLLSHTDLSITEIANQCGYDSIRSFNRNFLQFNGVSPKEYRLKNASF